MIQIRKIAPEKCYPIRQQVLWQHKNIDDCGIAIDDQKDAFHLGAYLNDKLVCIGSFFKQNHAEFSAPRQYRLRAMATLPKAQNKGLAKILLEKSFNELKLHDIDLLWCDARIVAKGFYSKLGFVTNGDSYEIPIIGTHYLMYKKI
jgi:ribosomal protein S18 acetylase RimI-like enzyme